MAYQSACMTCGACCAFFRVSFYWGELQSGGGVVPDALADKLNHHMSCMQGTNSKSPRCVALAGEVGQAVACTIYNERPSPCRSFSCNAESLEYNPDCDRARAHYGLPPLTYIPVTEVA